MGPDNVHLSDIGPDHVQNTFTQLGNWNLAFFFTSSLLIFHMIHYNTAIIFY